METKWFTGVVSCSILLWEIEGQYTHFFGVEPPERLTPSQFGQDAQERAGFFPAWAHLRRHFDL